MSEREQLRKQVFKLSCHDQFDLATRIAANIGYILAPESTHPDSPHTSTPTLEEIQDVLAALDKACRYLFPDRPPNGAFDKAKELIYRLASAPQPAALITTEQLDQLQFGRSLHERPKR